MPNFKLSPEVRKAILERVFGSTPERQKLLTPLARDVIEDLATDPNTRRMYLFGSSASDKPNPGDIDLLIRPRDYEQANYFKDEVAHQVPVRYIASPKASKERIDELTRIMKENHPNWTDDIARSQAEAFANQTASSGRDFMKVGRKRYGKDYKWIRLAGAGGAGAVAGEQWLTSEAEAAPPMPQGEGSSGWITNETDAPPPPLPTPTPTKADDLVHKVIKAESNFNPKAVSKKGAMGLMQLMPKTAKAMGVSDPFDPKQNVEGGKKYLNQLLAKYNGDQEKALAAYNAGPGKVDRLLAKFPDQWKQMLPKETRNYLAKVMGPTLTSSRTAIPQGEVVTNEGGWLTQESSAAPPPAALPPSTIAPPPYKMEGQHPVISAAEIDKINQQYGGDQFGPTGRSMSVEDPKLDFLTDLGVGTSAYLASSVMLKLAGRNPTTALGALAAGAIAAPLYVFSKGFMTKKPALEQVKELFPHHDPESLSAMLGGPEIDPGEFFWWTAGGEVVPVIARGVKGGVKGIMYGVDRMMHGPLQKVLKPFEPMGDKLWNVMIKPTQVQIPGIKKSVAEIFQPAVERMAKPGSGLENTAKTFRNIEVQKSHTRYLGEWMSKELNKLTPLERYDVVEGLKGADYEHLAPKAKDLLKRFDAGMQEAKLTTRYENSFREELGKMLQGKVGASSQALSDSTLKGLLDVMEKSLVEKAATGKTLRVRDIHKTLDSVISDPNASREVRAFARDLYNLPADTSEMVYTASNKASMQLLQQKLIDTKGVVSSSLKPGYVQTKIGKLNGLYVPRDVDLELNALVQMPKISRGFYQKWFLSPWKTSKVLLRPATHIRNMISNTILNDWGGLPFYRLDIYMKALRELASKGQVWKDFSQRSGHHANFVSSDIANMDAGLRYGANMFDRMYSLYQKAVAPAGSLYSAEESWFKLAKYMHNLEKGLTKNEAAMDAIKWTFNYAESTPEVARIGKYAVPFMRWYSKSVPLMVETAVKHPIRFGKWIAFGAGLQQYALNNTGTSEEEWEMLREQMPDYVKNGIYLPMPWRDEQGRLNLMNLTYIMPGIGDVNEMYQRSFPELVMQNPIMTIGSTLLSKRKFSGAPLYYEWEEPSVKVAKSLSYVWESLSPAVVPGGTDWNALYNAITQGAEGTGPTVEEAMAGWFGFKLTPVDPEANARRANAVQKIHDSEMASMMQKELRKATTNEQVEAILERYQKLREEGND